VTLGKINQALIDTDAELDRVRAEIALLPAFQRAGRRHLDLAAHKQRLLRQREALRGERQKLFRRN
jgi:hypothetical protein